MKAFKGCVNPQCGAYNKIKYRAEDKYCKRCGHKLEYVCADCWATLKNDKERYCSFCKEARQERMMERQKKVKKSAANVVSKGILAVDALPIDKVTGVAKKSLNRAEKIGRGALDKAKKKKRK